MASKPDLAEILREGRRRWLRPNEVCEILRNYKKFNLTLDPAQKPPGGSLFLFDRKALRYFRKDGHKWRKKKDGKTVREAHEKLKSGNVDVLHCYYAHGEDNEKIQRRCYWLLDRNFEHIVLVHYREVNETKAPCVPQLETATQCHVQGAQSNIGSQTSYVSNSITRNLTERTQSAELDDVDSGKDIGVAPVVESISGPTFPISCTSPGSIAYAGTTSFNAPGSSQMFSQNSGPHTVHLQEDVAAAQGSGFMSSWQPRISVDKVSAIDHWGRSHRNVMNTKMTNASLIADGECVEKYHNEEDEDPHQEGKNEADNVDRVHKIPCDQKFQLGHGLKSYTQSHVNASSNLLPEVETNDSQRLRCVTDNDLCGHVETDMKRLDSFSRWANREISGDCNDYLMATESGSRWNPLDIETDEKEVSSLSHQMQLDTDHMGPSLSNKQLFSILDFSPDWAYCNAETKVLVTGNFLGAIKPNNFRWCCMFGEVEVQAETLTSNVLRCQAPAHAAGRVPFYITCSNRLACSEIREFEYRGSSSGSGFYSVPKNKPRDEIGFQMRFAKMLSLGIHSKTLACSVDNCPNCHIKGILQPMLNENESEWTKMVEESKIAIHRNHTDLLVQKLLKSRLYEWLVCKAHDEGKGPNILDEEGQGIIHMAAALGYEWSMSAIVAAGVNPCFRDTHGRTALHWAAYFGREETVVALLRLGVAPGAVEDPTSKFPAGQTAADLASAQGHKGIAGYLAETDLTIQVSNLTIKESVIDSVSANVAAEKAIEIVEQKNFSIHKVKGEELALKGSLAAVRNSAQAAARIQAAFRMHSVRHKQSQASSNQLSQMSRKEIVASSMNRRRKVGHFTDSLHSAAITIQKKFRGWKGRKDFLRMRNRIVKIQAHVRGHQVRMLNKKVVWSVGILEKAILRWRRKGTGLRGFRAPRLVGDNQQETGKNDDYDFLSHAREQKAASVEKALARVQSMACHSEARDQYMRLVARSNFFKLGGQDYTDADDTESEDCNIEEDPSGSMSE